MRRCLLLSLVVMEKQVADLQLQLEKQCLINQELQRQNKELGEYNSLIFKTASLKCVLCVIMILQVNVFQLECPLLLTGLRL